MAAAVAAAADLAEVPAAADLVEADIAAVSTAAVSMAVECITTTIIMWADGILAPDSTVAAVAAAEILLRFRFCCCFSYL